MNTTPENILQKYWGYSEFRAPQKEIIESILAGKDTFALLPTGGGKSLCFQIPALMMEGVCVVISPLVALMKDQVQSLKKKGIKAEFLTSENTEQSPQVLMDNVRYGGVKLLYISPERMAQTSFKSFLENLKISYFAIDEAHCISEWGHDFRPSYLALKELKNEFPDKPILALTATATPHIQNEILKQLQIQNATIFKKSLQRKNLAYRIHQSTDKLDDLVYYLKKYPGSSIVFCKSRKQTYDIAKFLKEKKFNATYFHARLSKEDKNSRQKRFIESNDLVLVSTNAFGMGIDKPDVRLVVHYNAPSTIESYFQEVGRGGRDGKLSHGILLYHEEDKKKAIKQFKAALPSKEEFLGMIRKLYSYYQIAEGELREGQHAFSEKKIIKTFKFYKPKFKSVISFLEMKNSIKIHDSQRQSLVKINEDNYEIKEGQSLPDRLLDYIARHYGGVFSDPKPIDEYILSRKLDTSTSAIKEALQKLNQQEKIYYRDAAIKKISFLTQRDDNLVQNRYWKEFYDLQLLKWKRLNDVYFFIEDSSYCKSQLLLKYFGEKPKEKCGICNICNPYEGTQNITEKEIFAYLSENPKTQDEILFHFIKADAQRVLDLLQNLIDEEKIQFTLPNYYSICKAN
ncbi:RecQ family ATP-dependent DNA helicase [Ornithobacterium rhinotracheale]